MLNHASGERPLNICDVEFLDRESVTESEQLKGARFDVFARSDDGRIFHIEVQNAREKFFMERSFFYAASDYMLQARRGLGYDKLRPVIFIGLMNFNMYSDSGKDRDWYSLHRILNTTTHEHSFRDVEFHMIEMPVLKRYIRTSGAGVKDLDKLEDTLCYFGCIGGNKFVEEIAKRNSNVAEMLELEKRFRGDPIQMRNFLINERFRLDHEATLKQEREEGFDEGFDEGRGEKAIEMVRKLRSQGILTDEQISQVSDMPIELIRTL